MLTIVRKNKTLELKKKEIHNIIKCEKRTHVQNIIKKQNEIIDHSRRDSIIIKWIIINNNNEATEADAENKKNV